MDSWSKYEKLVISELERLNENYAELVKQLQDHRIKINSIETRSSIFGGLGGGVAFIIAALVEWLRRNQH